MLEMAFAFMILYKWPKLPYDHKNKKQMKFSIIASEKYFATRSFTLARGEWYNIFLWSKRPK